MQIVADEFSYVVGVDTHAKTHTFAVVETGTGRLIDVAQFPVNAAGIGRALTWVERRTSGPVLAAVECTGSYGAGLVAALNASSVPVVEVKPHRSAARDGRDKSDALDAEAAARGVLGRDVSKLTRPRAGKHRGALRVLLMTRRALDTHRTANRNMLTGLLRSVDLGVDVRNPLTDVQLAMIASWRSRPTDDVEQAVARAEAVRLAQEVLLQISKLEENRFALELHVRQLAPTLLQSQGIGPVTAAIFLTAYSHPGRVRNEAAFAALAGASPLQASSGNTTRYRLNRSGDRQLNRALEVVARVRLAKDPNTRTYTERRLAEGKSRREIRRLLKRYIARQVFRELQRSMT